jgi:hypothetical protein
MVQYRKQGLEFIVGTEDGGVSKCFFEIKWEQPEDSEFNAQY